MTRKNGQAGFTMGEMAIVLGVVALVMGGVWATVNKVQETARLEQAKEQVIVIAKNVRGFYQTRSCINTGDQTANLIAVAGQQIFPREMVVGNALVDLWNGGVQLQGAGALACDQLFIINFLALRPEICGILLPKLTGSGEVSRGLRWVSINGVNVAGLPTNPTNIIGAAAGQCGQNATANVALAYALRLSE